jgi:neutral ceramidase
VRRTRLDGVGGQRSGARPRRTVPVDILSFVDGDGSLTGLLVVLPVHPTVLGADNLRVSCDLAGAARRALAARTDAWVVVATGAAGDVSTRPHRLAQTSQECERLGGLVADAVLRALNRPARAVVPPGTPVVTAGERVPLEAKPPPGSPELIARLEGRLARARRGGSAVAERTAYTARQAAQLAATAPPPPPDPACAVAVAGIGPVSLVALGAEPYLALADRLDGRLDAATVLIGYTNGYLGYLPTRAAYRRSDYEVLRSPVAAGSAEDVLDRAARLAAGTRTHHRKDRP